MGFRVLSGERFLAKLLRGMTPLDRGILLKTWLPDGRERVQALLTELRLPVAYPFPPVRTSRDFLQ